MSSRKVVNLADFSKELGAWSKASLEEKKKAAVNGIMRSMPDLVANSPVDTGLYAASWDIVAGEDSVTVGNHAPYAGVIEYGARPFTPPLAPLLAWAKRVLTGQKDADGKLIQTGQPETNYSPEVWALAVHTQKKIQAEGMRPQHVMESAIPLIIKNIREEMKRGT